MTGTKAMVDQSNHEEHFELSNHKDGDQFASDRKIEETFVYTVMTVALRVMLLRMSSSWIPDYRLQSL